MKWNNFLKLQILPIRLVSGLWSCPTCFSTNPSLNSMKRHINSHTKSETFPCSTCEKTFTRKDNLMRHTKKYCNWYNLDLIANSNKESSFDVSNLLISFLLKLQPIPLEAGIWMCPHCSKTSSKAQNIQRHLVTHSSVKAFSCSYCGKSFKRRDVLNIHIRKFHS